MSRLSGDEIENGTIKNGFDYALQVWVANGIIQECGHPDNMAGCCNAGLLAGEKVKDVKGHETR